VAVVLGARLSGAIVAACARTGFSVRTSCDIATYRNDISTLTARSHARQHETKRDLEPR
jgi:hypothetical protein